MKSFIFLATLLLLSVIAFTQEKVSYPCTVSKDTLRKVYDTSFEITPVLRTDTIVIARKCFLGKFFCRDITSVVTTIDHYDTTYHIDSAFVPDIVYYQTVCDSIVPASTKFGVLINSEVLSLQQKASVAAESFKVQYVRGAITLIDFDGKSNNFETYAAKGLKIVLNLNWSQQNTGARPFCTDLTTYRQKLIQVLTKYKPVLVVIENEEQNKHYYTGSVAQYIAQLKIAIEVCHSFGIPVTNGGLFLNGEGAGLEILTYRYLRTISQTMADQFSVVMSSGEIKAAQVPNSNAEYEAKVRSTDSLLNAYVGLDYVNLHLYKPDKAGEQPDTMTTITPHIWEDAQLYIKYRTGKEVISNETCQRNNSSPALVTSMLTEFKRLKFPYVIWFSGDDGGAGSIALTNKDGSLRPNGIAFKNFVTK